MKVMKAGRSFQRFVCARVRSSNFSLPLSLLFHLIALGLERGEINSDKVEDERGKLKFELRAFCKIA
jgi:hypothetical protein